MTFTRWLNGFTWGVCFHQEKTAPHKDEEGEYRRCLGCGLRIPWSLAGPILPPPHLTQLGENQYDEMFLRDMKMEGKP